MKRSVRLHLLAVPKLLTPKSSGIIALQQIKAAWSKRGFAVLSEREPERGVVLARCGKVSLEKRAGDTMLAAWRASQ